MGFAQRITFIGLSTLIILGLALLTIEALSDGSTIAVAESVQDGLVAAGNRIADQIP